MAPKINVIAKATKSFYGLTLTTPAIIAFVAYIVLALVILLPFEFPVVDQDTGKTYIVKYDFAQRLIVMLLMSIPIILSVYTINCMMAGNCVLWSYVVSVITAFWVGLFVITGIVYSMKK
jgi:hypothetical protein